MPKTSTTTITQVEPLAVMTDEQRQEAAAKRDLESQHLQCEVVFPGAVQRWGVGLANVVLMLYERPGTTIVNHCQLSRYDHLTPELAGFCPVALLSGSGFLLPGCPRLGLNFLSIFFCPSLGLIRQNDVNLSTALD